MKRVSFFLGWIFLLIVAVSAQDKIVKLKIVETSDIHGNYYPYDFILRHEAGGSLARIHAFVQKEREVYKDNLLLLDNGDILQGQPCAYYYNYIDNPLAELNKRIFKSANRFVVNVVYILKDCKCTYFP